MPTLNGFQIVDKLISEKINIPKIILVTGHHEVLSSFNSSNFIYGILLKPINYNSLIETLNVIVEERKYKTFNAGKTNLNGHKELLYICEVNE